MEHVGKVPFARNGIGVFWQPFFRPESRQHLQHQPQKAVNAHQARSGRTSPHIANRKKPSFLQRPFRLAPTLLREEIGLPTPSMSAYWSSISGSKSHDTFSFHFSPPVGRRR
jgi:hypothetical protein